MYCQSLTLSAFKISFLVGLYHLIGNYPCSLVVKLWKSQETEIVVFALIITVHEIPDVSNLSSQIFLSMHFCLLDHTQVAC